MWNQIRLWARIAWFCKTPFVFPQDREYQPLTDEQVEKLFSEHEQRMVEVGYRWTGEIWDCDDAQSIFKGIASQLKMNGVWNVSGYKGRVPWKRRHAFGLMLTDTDGFRFVEPQNVRKSDMSGYHASGVMWG